MRRISPDGIITLAAGNGQTGFGGDGGPAIQASFGDADGLAVDSTGNLYIADFNNNRVRVVLTATPTLSATPTALSFLATSGGVTAGPQAINVTSSLPGLQVAASSDSPWLIVPSTIAYAPGSISISADPTGLAPGTYQGNVSLLSPGLTSVLTTVHVTFRVNSAVDPQLTTDVSELTFSLTSGGAPQSQSLQVLNTGSGQMDFLVVLTGAGSAGSYSVHISKERRSRIRPLRSASRPIRPSFPSEQPPLRCSSSARIFSLRPSPSPSRFPPARRKWPCRKADSPLSRSQEEG